MNISKISLTNYRKFEKIDIEFDNKLSVLIGKNGTGKTSILEALAVAVGTFFFALDGISSIGIRGVDVYNKYFSIGEDIDVQKQFPVEIIANGSIEGQKIEWKRSLNSIAGKTTSVDAKKMTSISKSYQERLMRGDTSLKLPLVAYYGTGRLWDEHREKWGGIYRQNTRVNGYIDCLDGRANVRLLLDWFKRMTIKANQNGKPNETYLAVKGAMEKCFSRLTGVEGVNVSVNPDTFSIEINYNDVDRGWIKIPLEQLSDGYRCALSLIGDIAYRMATLNPQLAGNVLTETEGIILIDEIDLHLHPEWQQHILSDLTDTFPKIQFIVTTHAPAIINSIPNGSLLVISDDNDIVNRGADSYGQDINTVVKTIMGASVRPKKIQELFDTFYSALDEQNIERSQAIIDELRDLIDVNDAELAACIVKQKLVEHRVRK